MTVGVVICWKIRIFAYWTTPLASPPRFAPLLWFAEKFVSLLIEQHHLEASAWAEEVVICWKIRIFAYWTTPLFRFSIGFNTLWFAEKFVSLLIEQHREPRFFSIDSRCDLLKNSYLCLLNNTLHELTSYLLIVVICWKIRIFAYWTTPHIYIFLRSQLLWFAEKFVSLLIEQHPLNAVFTGVTRCDLLKNSYLCLLNNTARGASRPWHGVVICWKIRIFAYWTTPHAHHGGGARQLWFAEKFVSLLIEQHLIGDAETLMAGCDLLKNSYLCLLNNTSKREDYPQQHVVICWKIRIFAYWTTPEYIYRFIVN